MAAALGIQGNFSNGVFKDKEKPTAVRSGNILAARAVAEAVRTSLGPRGMDKVRSDPSRANAALTLACR